VDDDRERFVALVQTTRIPLIVRHIGRRAASIADTKAALDLLVTQLSKTDSDIQSELLAGIMEGLEGQRRVAMPDRWPQTFAKLQAAENEAVRERSLQLALIFDDPAALAMLRKVAADGAVDGAKRNRALQALVAKQASDVAPLLLRLVEDEATRRAAIRGLAEYDDPETPAALLQRYGTFDAAARQDVLQTLASRPAWAMQLVNAIEAGGIPRSDVTAYTARQVNNLGNETLSARLKTVWGELRTTPAEKAQTIANIKRRLTPESLARADRAAGRAVFQKTCANCHRIFDAGGAIGPDITGSQRTNLDYLLQTLVDPSAAVAKDYQVQIIATSGGRVITGLVVAETKAAVTIQTVNEKVVVPVAEIEQRTLSPLSMMPEGMLQNLSTDEVRALLAYLMGSGQAPLPGESAQ
jgi:putative heme-binding domain-containing protein